ncbi:MAG: amidohydrolase family protein [Phycisphaerae bacterium]|nr:amidohydrolase family protein [Phycisphaerae bacterium]
MLGVSDRLGTIAKGMAASLIVADGPLFRKKTKIREVYIEGARHEITPRTSEIAGTWEARGSDGARWRLLIDHENVIRVELPGTGDTPVTRKARQTSLVDSRVSFVAELGPSDSAEPVVLSALAQGESMIGAAVASGRTWTWEAARTSKELPKPRPSAAPTPPTPPTPPPPPTPLPAAPTDPSATTPPVDSSETRDRTEGDRPDSVSSVSPPDTTNGLEADEPEFGALAEGVPEPSGFPFGPYSVPAPPGAARVAIVGATVWTSGPRGTIAGGVVYVDAGKIRFVGDANEWTRFARELGGAEPDRIDATGKHLTPGLIDCHSHTGISKGVNEAGQAVTAEVRIADVTDPDAINWYRQLAGGLTVVNSLHGSANPIGGQNCVNKIRWGVERPDDMHMEGVVGGIKFALGENVTQANWSDRAAPRYPRTRMGVETLLRDRFAAAREYSGVMEAWAARGGRPGDRPRRDLELEALAEVLAGTRLVHCHSYRQDEILMLCRVAGEFGFTIGTFQHGLECYKVADEVKRSALGASLFSDWWSYKVEVQDAIPQAGPILHERGVVVSYNSDSDEMARRMNTEAAKAARYGDGLSPEDALKFVTINPARQLKIDARTGSIEAGKDADLALWSGDPLSAFSRCEATWVDGRALFSLEADARARETIAKERTRLLAKLLAEKKKTKPKADRASDEKNGAPGPRERAAGEGDHLAQLRQRNLDLLRRGIDPGSMPTDGCGDCGQSETRDR